MPFCRLLAAIQGMKQVMVHSAELLLSVDPKLYTYKADNSFFDVVSQQGIVCHTNVTVFMRVVRSFVFM